MILFSAISHSDCMGAYQWHRGFSGANDSLFPRTHEDFQDLVMQGSVWAAREANGDFLALAYSSYDHVENVCEIGGLMVATQARGKGLGLTMMQLALAHSILEDGLLDDPRTRVVAHVLKSNPAPRRLIEEGLKFHFAKQVEIPSAALPGLRADDDGMIRGDEFEMSEPDSLLALVEWARSWSNQVGDSTADVELREGVDMHLWADALAELAGRQ